MRMCQGYSTWFVCVSVCVCVCVCVCYNSCSLATELNFEIQTPTRSKRCTPAFWFVDVSKHFSFQRYSNFYNSPLPMAFMTSGNKTPHGNTTYLVWRLSLFNHSIKQSIIEVVVATTSRWLWPWRSLSSSTYLISCTWLRPNCVYIVD